MDVQTDLVNYTIKLYIFLQIYLQGTVIYDPEFQNAFGNFNKVNATLLVTLCKLCQLIAKNSKLVRNGTAQCLPDCKCSILLLKQK